RFLLWPVCAIRSVYLRRYRLLARLVARRAGALLSVDDLGALARLHAATIAGGVDLGELGPKEEDLRRVVDPDQQHHQRAGRAVGGAKALPPQIEAQQLLTDDKEQGRDKRAQPYIAPGDPHIG